MARLLSLFFAFCLGFFVLTANSQEVKKLFNQQLADSLHADEYGMSQYYLVILKTGQIEIKDKQIKDSLFKLHMNNIGRLANAGQLIVAGPLDKNMQNYRGIFIFKHCSRSALNEMLQADPTIRLGIFDTEIFEWYGSAALPMYLPFHKQIEKTSFN